MAKRTLEDLQRQYNLKATAERRGMPMGPRGGRGGPMPHGKPKNTANTIKRLWGYVSKYKFRLVLVLFCMLISTLTSLIGGYMIAPIINRITLAVAPNASIEFTPVGKIADGIIEKISQIPLFSTIASMGDFAEVAVYVLAAIAIMFLVYMMGIVSSYLQARIMLSVSQNATQALRNDLFSKLMQLPTKYFDTTPTGEVMSRFTNDVDNIDVMLNNSLTSVVSGFVSIVGTLVFMITTNIWLTLITVLFIPIFIKGGAIIGARSRKYHSGQQAALGAVNGYIEETVTGQKVVKVFNHEETCVEEFELLNGDLRDKQFKAQFFGGIMGPIMHNTSMISYAVTIGVGGVLMCLTGFGPGDLTVFANYSRQFSMPINQLSMQINTVFSALAGAERVFAVMDADPETVDKENAVSAENMKGYVKLDNVTFGYNPDKVILKNISLYAKPGQKIAFVGSTGAGKTTVTNLISRFYDIDSGSITIDDVDIRDYKRSELREKIAMVLQDTHLFSGTVMENIRYGRLDATDEEVIAAAKTASAHSFIMRLSNGYQTQIEGDGTNLSQGQRQLLNIARAALSKAPILILDEATSSVDTRTERHIEKGLDRLMSGRTTFVIAHRLSTVRNANAIMVLEQGEIIERGDHEDLLEQKGRYWQLYTGAIELD